MQKTSKKEKAIIFNTWFAAYSFLILLHTNRHSDRWSQAIPFVEFSDRRKMVLLA